jgi:novobiocin biosynthesis protein NovU/D-mycarose 3-C-methyltransferase
MPASSPPDQSPPVAPPPQQALAEHLRAEYLELAAKSALADPSRWERKTCRACLADGLVEVLNLGDMPPANALVRLAELSRPEPRFPLSVRLCRRCGMVQLGHVVPAELLFRSYLFFTSTSRKMSEHFAALMADATGEFVRPGGLVIEIGSNDGTALSSIRRRDVRLLGIDPARNIAVMAAARGVPTVSEFFTEPLAREIARVAGPAQLIVACNVLGHIDDLDDVCRGIAALLAPGGALVVEVPYVADLVERAEYDTVYHEHLSYFAIRPLATLFNRHGLRVERVQFFPVHGGTMRVTAVPGAGVSMHVQHLIEGEIAAGLGAADVHLAMARAVEAQRVRLRATLAELKAAGKKVIGYGAPAKATVVLNYCNIGTDLLPMVVDSTPAKQGFHVPGTHQPILPPSALADARPDALLLLAWNHAKEITERESAFIAAGGKFLLPHGGTIG